MIRVGTAGWSYADWEGVVYPRRKPRGFHPLRELARWLGCVEINSSFYALPRAEHAAQWVRHVEDWRDFRFTAKLLGRFTHEPLPGSGRGSSPELQELARAFLAGLEPLQAAGRLAAVLVQFPLSFRVTGKAAQAAALQRLARIRGLLHDVPLVLEVRHASWLQGETLERARELGYAVAAIDLPPGRDHPPPEAFAARSSGPLGYLRLHGRNVRAWFDPGAGRDDKYDYLYAAREVSELVRVAQGMAPSHGDLYVVTNNHFAGKAVANALELLAGLGGEPPAVPASLVEAYPRLSACTRSTGQGSLF